MSHQEKPLFSDIQKELGNIVFVKPANLGSSVGVSRVTTEEEFMKALEEAFLYDTKLLIEEAIVGREIECSVLGNENPKASMVGEVITNTEDHSFYSYEAKYLDENGATIVIPAEMSPEKTTEIQAIAVKVFQTL
jgi:D-alanine-D-alanine ligase